MASARSAVPFLPITALLLAAAGASGCAGGPGSRALTGAEAVGSDIYRTVDYTAGLPLEFLKPIVVRTALQRYIAGQDLPEDVESRLSEAIRSPGFMDRTIPFVLFLKETYERSRPVEDFETAIKKRYSSRRSLPGVEHSLMRWEEPPAAPAEPAPAGEEKETEKKPPMVRGLLRIFDAIFLHPRSPSGGRQRVDPEMIERTRPVIRDLLQGVLAELPDARELKGALQKVIEDAALLEAVTVSLIEATRGFAFKNQRRFLRRMARQEQLRQWLLNEVEKEGGGGIVPWLRQAAEERRYGVLILVDGLQGHLVEALARGSGESAFIRQVLREETEPPPRPAGAKPLKEAPASSIAFLRAFAEKGYRDPDYLPFLRGIFDGGAGGVAVGGISTTPTISVRNIPVVLTGASIAGLGGTGIPNFHFLDRRKDRAYYFFGSDAIELGPLTREAGLKTLFSRLEHLSSLSATAQYDEEAHFGTESMINLAVGEKRRDFGETLLLSDLEVRAETEVRLGKLRRRLAEVVSQRADTARWRFVTRWLQGRRAGQLIADIVEEEDRGMPQVLVYYNPWPDHFAHPKGPFSDEVVSPTGELNRLDHWLGRIDDVYRRAGVHDRTLFAMAGDHGVASSRYLVDAEEEVFGGMARDGIRLEVRKISVDEGAGPRLTNPLAPPSMKRCDVVLSSTAGGNCTLDLFSSQGGSWDAQPTHREVAALRTLEGKTVDMVEQIRSRLAESMDYLAVREETCSPSAAGVRLVATREGRRADALILRRGRSIHYHSPEDLLEIGALSPYAAPPAPPRMSRYRELLQRARAARAEDISTWLLEDEWRELCSFTARPDAVGQLARLYDTDLAGTVNLFPRAGYAFNSRVPGRHAGETFHEKDAFVGIWGKPVQRTARPATAYNGSVAPTIFEHLTGTRVEAGRDGWGFPAIPREDPAPPAAAAPVAESTDR